METVVEVRDNISDLAPEWEALARRLGAGPFLYPGWFEAWWSAFGSGELHILAARRRGELVGVLPLRRSGSVLRSATNSHTPHFGLLADDEAAAREVSKTLFSQRARRVEVSFLPSGDASPIRAFADEAGYRTLSESEQASPYISTEGGWGEYEERMRKRFSKLRRRQRKFEEKNGRLTLDVSDGKEKLELLLDEGFRVEGLGWKDSYGTSIDSQPSTRRFYTDIARWAADKGWLRLAFLRLEGKAIAFDYCLEHDGRHGVLKTGYDPEHRVFAPGMIMRRMMISRAFSEGLRVYDFLGANDAWKQEWTNACHEQFSLRMFAPTALGSAEHKALIYGRSMAGPAKDLAGTILGERGLELAKRSLAATRAKLGR